MGKLISEIDLTLTILCSLANRGDTLTTIEIAELCECSQTIISKNLRSGLKKLSHSKLQDFNE